MAAAARAAGRKAEDVTLVAVSKQQPWDAIEPVLGAGQRIFGENRVQEASARWSGPRLQVQGLELRLIGPLQTNKADDALALFDVIETLDRPTLATALAKAIQKAGARRGSMCRSTLARSPRRRACFPPMPTPSSPPSGATTASRSKA